MKPIKLILSLVTGVMLLAVTSSAQNGLIYHVAGGQGSQLGYSGDGGLAINAVFGSLINITLDGSDNIYIADMMNHRIRKIDGNTGIVTTIVGNGNLGFSGDGGLATNAQVSFPSSVALDLAGNLYICDDLNYRIRKVDVNGIITTYAGDGSSLHSGDGGLAINAGIAGKDLSIDINGNIFVAEEEWIRKIDAQTGIISTIAGTGNLGFSGDGGLAINAAIYSPRSISFDTQGNIYFICENRIRKIDASTGIITTIAGSGINGNTGDGGLAVNADLDFPQGTMIDASNDIYISTVTNIRKIDGVTGIISTFAGNGMSLFNGVPASLAGISPGSFVKNIYGTIYFEQTGWGSIYKITNDIPLVDITSTLFSIQVFEQCNGPQFIAATPQYNPGHTLHTYYGDGHDDVVSLSPSYNSGHAIFNHPYAFSGSYSVKHVLLDNNVPVDSIEYTHQYSLCRTVSKTLYTDINSDCLYDANTDVVSILPSAIAVDSNGLTIDTIWASSGFTYNMQGSIGDVYSFEVIDHPGGMHLTCPPNGITTDTISSSIYTSIGSIGMECDNTSDFDLSLMVPFTRTGANRADVDILVHNLSCFPQDATLTMTFSPKYELFVNFCSPTPISYTANTVTWDFNDVSAMVNEPLYVHAVLWANNNVYLTPGDTVQTTFNLSPTTGDINPTNNIVIRHDTVTGPYDPNAIYVSPSYCVTPGTNLEYTVTFENLGNDTAHNVYIMDTLSNGYQMQSMKLIAASHNVYITKSTSGGHNILKFDFPGIDLADSSSPARHGFVKYSIDVDDNFPIGSAVTNKAGIFFDYMPAVLTNVAETYMCWPASVNTVAKTDDIRIYPNPVTGNELTVFTEQAYASFIITNSIGQELMNGTLHGKDTKVNIKPLATGIYYITLRGDKGTVVKKFVKL